MHETNLIFAWVWIGAGLLAGAVQGLGFHREQWMGGYASWRRRLTRLGHIAFLGTAVINLAYAFTIQLFDVSHPLLAWISPLLIIGAVAMPTVCYLSAWRMPLRNLFAIPVLALIGGVGLFAYVVIAAAAEASP